MGRGDCCCGCCRCCWSNLRIELEIEPELELEPVHPPGSNCCRSELELEPVHPPGSNCCRSELELELVHPPLARATHLRIELELELALAPELERDHLEPPGARPAQLGTPLIFWVLVQVTGNLSW